MTPFELIHHAAIAAGQADYDHDGGDITFDYYNLTERAEYCRPVAWLCTGSDDLSVVIHACSAIEAFWVADACYDITEASVERIPAWDNREFTPKAAIEAGWVWRCGNCAHQIDWEGCSRHDNVEPVYTPDSVYCCEECAP